jgi:hypothetical protein
MRVLGKFFFLVGIAGSAKTKAISTSDGVPHAPRKPRGTWPAVGFHRISPWQANLNSGQGS